MAQTNAPFLLLSAFATSAHTGNPAAVIIVPSTITLTDTKMQAIGKDLVQPMCAFVSPPCADTGGDYGIRWFNTENELPMCLHATLAAAKAVWSSPGQFDAAVDVLKFRTAFGAVVSASRQGGEGGAIEITFPDAPTVQIAHDSPEGAKIRDVISKAFGAQETGEELEVRYMGHGTGQYAKYVLVDVAETGGFKLEGRKVMVDAFRESPFPINVITSAGDESNGESFVSRTFSPNVGCPEDHVCGSAHCLLTLYWAHKRSSSVAPNTPMKARQVSERGGILQVRWDPKLESVTVGGDVVLWAQGAIDIQ
ncbi:Diaminopimelate epimerase-like protein [Athelia psychrophila]|uniref:Diaminopimelate epimerase-like protein n=1 Tax=Athelia psychrophila TaxID=1759441 RepID=A0A166TJF0_9AGAM|nr:Diaminopimelate epimerase-like protein [Fibularhizoctonia sp. CBS 109695]